MSVEKTPDIEYIKNNDIKTTLKLSNIPAYLANSFRRACSSMVPIITFDDTYTDDISKRSIQITKNTSALHNEFLSHRLSLIPINVNYFNIDTTFDSNSGVRKFKLNNKNIDYFSLKSQNTSNTLHTITTNDFVPHTITDSTQIPIDNIIPLDYYTKDPIIIDKLKPNISSPEDGEELDIICYPVVGQGKMNARYDPTGTVTYEFEKDDSKLETVFHNKIKYLNNERKSKGLQVLNESETQQLKRSFDLLDSDRVYHKDDNGNVNKIVISVESIGFMSPNQIILDAISMLMLNVKDIQNSFEFIGGKFITNPKIQISELDNTNVNEGICILIKDENHTMGNLISNIIRNYYCTHGTFLEKDVLKMISYRMPHPTIEEIEIIMVPNDDLNKDDYIEYIHKLKPDSYHIDDIQSKDITQIRILFLELLFIKSLNISYAHLLQFKNLFIKKVLQYEELNVDVANVAVDADTDAPAQSLEQIQARLKADAVVQPVIKEQFKNATNFNSYEHDDFYTKHVLIKTNLAYTESSHILDTVDISPNMSISTPSTFPSYNMAIIVPYRHQESLQDADNQDRRKHREQFIKHMTIFNTKISKYVQETMGISLKVDVYIMEQSDDGKKFNRGSLLNAGFIQAIQNTYYSSVIMHDIDLLPTDNMVPFYAKGIFTTTGPLASDKKVIHLAHKWSRYQSKTYLGGVTMFKTDFFNDINGFPTYFAGWGGEDDALRERIIMNTNKTLKDIVEYPTDIPDDGGFIDLEHIDDVREKRQILQQNAILDNRLKDEGNALEKTLYKYNGLVNISTLGNLVVNIVKDDAEYPTGIVQYTVDLNESLTDYNVMKDETDFSSLSDKYLIVTEPKSYYDYSPENTKCTDDIPKIKSPVAPNVTTDIPYVLNNDQLLTEIHSKLSNQVNGKKKTLQYMFNHIRTGNYLRINNNMVTNYIPFYNIKYRNTWSNLIEGGIQSIPNNGKPDKWTATNCLLHLNWDAEEDAFSLKTFLQIPNMFIEMCNYFNNNGYKLPDVDLFINTKDFPVHTKDNTQPFTQIYGNGAKLPEKYHDLYPILSFNGNDAFSDYIIPTNQDWSIVNKLIYPSYCENFFTKDPTIVEWSNKKPIALFRGKSTGCSMNVNRNPRLHISKLDKEWNDDGNKKDLMDAGITSFAHHVVCEKTDGGHIISNGADKSWQTEFTTTHLRDNTLKDGIPMYEQSQYKYIINIPGNSAAYRFTYLLKTGSLILNVESENKLWWEKYTTPYDITRNTPPTSENCYINVSNNLDNLEQTIKWCQNNDAYCKQIADNAKKFYTQKINKESIFEYLKDIIESISSD